MKRKPQGFCVFSSKLLYAVTLERKFILHPSIILFFSFFKLIRKKNWPNIVAWYIPSY